MQLLRRLSRRLSNRVAQLRRDDSEVRQHILATTDEINEGKRDSHLCLVEDVGVLSKDYAPLP